MPLVVFLRGVNVGGHKAFSPAALARDMAALDVVSIGAAGTFVVRKLVSQSALRAEMLRRLPFAPELMICRSAEVLGLLKSDPFPDGPETKQYVTVMAKQPRELSRLPIAVPPGKDWQVKVFAVSGRFVLSLWRRRGKTLIYPNEVVEKQFGVTATTRNWNTIEAVGEVLQSD